jgi:predicted enzyme related to lactoylglutathione lyase
MKALKEALRNDGIPFTAFEVDDVAAEFRRLQALGVEFTREPTEFDGTWFAVFDDTCGNLVQIYQVGSS